MREAATGCVRSVRGRAAAVRRGCRWCGEGRLQSGRAHRSSRVVAEWGSRMRCGAGRRRCCAAAAARATGRGCGAGWCCASGSTSAPAPAPATPTSAPTTRRMSPTTKKTSVVASATSVLPDAASSSSCTTAMLYVHTKRMVIPARSAGGSRGARRAAVGEIRGEEEEAGTDSSAAGLLLGLSTRPRRRGVKRRCTGMVAAVPTLVLCSVLLPLAFPVGLHRSWVSGSISIWMGTQAV